MRIRFQYSWFIFTVLLIALLASILTQVMQADRQMAGIRNTFAASELLVTRSVLDTLEESVERQDWTDIIQDFGSLQQATRSERLLIAQSDGKVLVDSVTGDASAPISSAFMQEAMVSGQALRWKPGEDVLQVAVKIPPGTGANTYLLIREVALQPELLQVRSVQLDSLLRTLLTTLVLGVLGAVFIWVIGVKPLKRLQETVVAVSEGDLSQRVEVSPVAELNDLGRVFNQMLDEVEAKREALESLNSTLEKTIAERTLEIEQASQDLKQRAASIDAINQIFNAASTSLNLRELASVALKRIMQALEADYGGIVVEGEAIASTYPPPLAAFVARMLSTQNPHSDVRLLVPDWLANDLPNELEGISRPILTAEVRSSIHVAVRVGQHIIGRIDLASTTPRRWNDNDLNHLSVIGQQMGTAIQRLQDYEESLENSRMMARLAGLAGLLNRPLDAAEVVETIGKGLIDLSGAPRAAIFQFSKTGEIEPLWSHHLPRRLLRSLVTRTRAEPTFFLPVNPMPDMVSSTTLLPEEKHSWWEMAGSGIQAYASWPLTIDNQQNAVAVCFHDRPIQYSTIQKEVLEAFTRQAATALRNARLLQLEREQRSLAEALQEVTSVLTSTLERNEVIERILTNLSRVLEHDGANVMMLDGDMLYIVGAHGRSLPETQIGLWRNPLSRFKVMHLAYEMDKTVVIPDTDRESRWLYRPESAWIKSFATAPVRSRGRIIGFVNVSSRQNGFFTTRHGEILQAFADQASMAMENAQRFQVTRDQVDESNTMLRALAPLLAAEGDLETVSNAIAQAVVREFEHAHCSVMLVDRERRCVRVFKEAGDFLAGIYTMPLDGPGLTVEAINTGKVVYAADVSKHSNYVTGVDGVQSELVVPMIAGGEAVGAINVESMVLNAFNDRAQRMLVTFAERAALVVTNAQLLESSRAGERQMRLLNEITQVSLSGGEPATIFKAIIERVAALIGADGAYMTGWEAETERTTPLAAYGPNSEIYTQDIPEPGERNLTYALMQKGAPIAVDNVFETSVIPRQVAALFPVTSLLGVPMQVNGHRLGAILVGFIDRHAFTQTEIGVIQQAAGLIALILARMNALRQAEKRAADSERLRQAGTALTTTLDIEALAGLIIHHLQALLTFDTALVSLVSEGSVRPVAYRQLPAGDALLDTHFPVDDPILLRMISSDEPIRLVDAQTEADFQNWGGSEGVHSWLGLALRAGNQVIGVVGLGRCEVKPFGDDEVLLARLYSNQAGIALQNAVLHARQQQLAITDPLTELYNRRGFFELARHEIERSRRFNRPLTFMMLDIDHFKLVNDQYGHAVGDEVLRELAERLRAAMREVDLIGRYGGEEFCILLPESDCQAQCRAVERVLEVVRGEPFVVGSIQVSITVSIGVTTLTSINVSLEELIQQSDEALYHAKDNGRNRAEFWGGLSLETVIFG